MSEIKINLQSIDNEGFHPLIKLEINNKMFNAILDTGASQCVFDINQINSFANSDNLDQTDKLSIGLGTSNMESKNINIDIKIGSLMLKNYKIAVIDLSNINTAYQNLGLEPVIGVIGCDLLKQTNAVIDFKTSKLSLTKF